MEYNTCLQTKRKDSMFLSVFKGTSGNIIDNDNEFLIVNVINYILNCLDRVKIDESLLSTEVLTYFEEAFRQYKQKNSRYAGIIGITLFSKLYVQCNEISAAVFDYIKERNKIAQDTELGEYLCYYYGNKDIIKIFPALLIVDFKGLYLRTKNLEASKKELLLGIEYNFIGSLKELEAGLKISVIDPDIKDAIICTFCIFIIKHGSLNLNEDIIQTLLLEFMNSKIERWLQW